MSTARSFQLSGGRASARSVSLYLVYVECMAGLIGLSVSYVSVVFFAEQLMVDTAGCGFSRTCNVLRIVVVHVGCSWPVQCQREIDAWSSRYIQIINNKR